MEQRSDWSTDLGHKLDHQHANRFYWSLTIMATVGGFLFGYDTSNIGSALNFIPYPCCSRDWD